ncbi:Non-specific lipid transfer protein GPI-anchored 5 [Linum grandiflorum]
MEVTKMAGVVIATMVALLWAEGVAQSGGGGGCTSVLISMAPCVNYVTGTSTTPSSSCCSQLANVVRSNPRCLCEVLSGGAASLGVSINKTLALQLPASCNVKTPPVSRCNDVGASAPAGAPTQAVPGDHA